MVHKRQKFGVKLAQILVQKTKSLVQEEQTFWCIKDKKFGVRKRKILVHKRQKFGVKNKNYFLSIIFFNFKILTIS